MKTTIKTTVKMLLLAALVMTGANAHAILTSHFVTGGVSLVNATEGQVYQQANLGLYINPSQTNWMAWSRVDHLVSYNGAATIDGASAIPNFGIDDTITLSISGPKNSSIQGVQMDFNDKWGNSSGQQAVLFGNQNVAPDVVRFNLKKQATVFDEGGILNSFFNTAGAGWYNLHFDFNNLWTNNAGHQSVYLLVDTFVPEPATLVLSALGLAGLAMLRRRRAQRTIA